MHWSRVKTILILIFLAIDIILLSTIIMTSHTVNTIDDALIDDTVSILQRNNIRIDKNTVPKTIKSLGVVELKNIWTDNEKAATALTGSAPATTEGGFVSGTKQTSFSGNEFYYSDSSPAGITPSTDGYRRAFENMGIYANENFIEISGNTVNAKQSVDGNVIFETFVTAQINQSGGITQANGYWILSDSQNSVSKKSASPLTPITGVLINFLQNPHIPSGGVEITSIETGYSLGNIYRDTMHKLVSVIPAYKISTSEGNHYMYDAVTGDFLYASINNEILY